MNDMSKRGKVVVDVMNHINNDWFIGKRIKSGELRKKLVEPEWKVSSHLTCTRIDREHYSMKLLASKVNPAMDKVFLLLHGGGYVAKIRNVYYSFGVLLNQLSDGCNVLIPDYRIAPQDPFPAALEDALDAYKWLIDRGYYGEQIIFCGDSAGGGLAMALTHYLKDHHMPMPCGIIAMSPWTDVTASGESYEKNFEQDILFGKTKDSMIYQNPYPGETDPMDYYISPKFGDFRGFPPMLIQVGSTEMLLSDSVDVAAKARSQSVKVRLSIYEGMFHVFQMCLLAIPESKKAWAEIGKFIKILKEE